MLYKYIPYLYIYIYRCFLKWWYPQNYKNTPKWSFWVGKAHGCWGNRETHHCRKDPYIAFMGPISLEGKNIPWRIPWECYRYTYMNCWFCMVKSKCISKYTIPWILWVQYEFSSAAFLSSFEHLWNCSCWWKQNCATCFGLCFWYFCESRSGIIRLPILRG